MSYKSPVGKPEDPYERYRVERIEADKRSREEFPKPEEKEAKSRFALGGYLLLLFHRFLDIFEGKEGKAEKGMRKHLLLIQDAFNTLKQEDRSQDSAYLNRLSDLWHKALEDALRFQQKTPLALQFTEFVQDIDTYPPDQEFSFGYYLTEYAGQKWLPLPYVELVKKIHDDHEKNPESSALSRWTSRIDDLIKQIGSNAL